MDGDVKPDEAEKKEPLVTVKEEVKDPGNSLNFFFFVENYQFVISFRRGK